jgi:hypothetical protein
MEMSNPFPAVAYKCPENCLGVEKIEGPNAIATRNIVTGQRREWRFCRHPPVRLYAGYVIELTVAERGDCQDLNRADLFYHIIRGKETEWKAVYADVTYDDGPDRPVLARNCHNTADDKDVICEGGDARFDREISLR